MVDYFLIYYSNEGLHIHLDVTKCLLSKPGTPKYDIMTFCVDEDHLTTSAGNFEILADHNTNGHLQGL